MPSSYSNETMPNAEQFMLTLSEHQTIPPVFCFRTEVEMSGIEDIAVSKYSTKKAFDKSISFINPFE
jgi:hypothetical protein